MADDLARWPGASRRRPPQQLPTWVVALGSRALAAGAGGRARRRRRRCGSSTSAAASSRTTRSSPASRRSTSGSTSSRTRRPSCSGRSRRCRSRTRSFDVVLCTQVLEHCDDPAQAVRELRRVTRPGGRVLASTHGVQVYHPSPVDYWRWTHDGPRAAVRASTPTGRALSVEPAAGTASALAMLLGTYVEIALRRTVLARPPVWLLNRAAAARSNARSSRLREPIPGSLIPNFHVVARP